MPFIAVLHNGKEAIFVNRPIKKKTPFIHIQGK